MKTIPLGILAALVSPGVASAEDLVWSISGSSTDPFVNRVPAAPGSGVHGRSVAYLWLARGPAWRAMEVEVRYEGLATTSFAPVPGVVNTGDARRLRLSTAEGSPGPVLVGAFRLTGVAGGTICLAGGYVSRPRESSAGDQGVRGPAASRRESCVVGGEGFPADIDPETWGRVKSLYR